MIRGTKRPVPRRTERIALMAKIHNRYDVEVIDAATGELKQTARGYNVICTNWWQSAFPSWTYIVYGSGSGTPAASDTALFHYEGYKSFASRTTDTEHLADGYFSVSRVATLHPSDAVGVTLTELGLQYGYGPAIMTHALLQDMNGNPVSITKTDTDIIKITATVFYHFQPSYQSGKLRLTDSVLWIADSLYGKDISTVLLSSAKMTSPSGYAVDTSAPWTPANKTISYKARRIEANSANLAGGYPYLIVCFDGDSYSTAENYIFAFPSGMSQITGEAIGTGDGATTDFATAFALPQQAKVYVNGVEQSAGVTVVPDIPGATASKINGIMLRLSKQATGAAPLISRVFRDVGRYYIYASEGPAVFVNLFPDQVPVTDITFISSFNTEISASDDLSNWTQIHSGSARSVSVPSAQQGKKYWKISYLGTGEIEAAFKSSDLTGYAIRFATAPAAGAVITADYKTPMIPKDVNHVIDFAFSLTFGEYSEG